MVPLPTLGRMFLVNSRSTALVQRPRRQGSRRKCPIYREIQPLPPGVADGGLQGRELDLQPGQRVGAAGPAHDRLDETPSWAAEGQAPASGIASGGTHGG